MESAGQNTRWYETGFEQLERSLNGEKSGELHALRRTAIGLVAELGFPTLKQEEWRFTNIAPIAKTEFQLALDHERSHLVLDDVKPFFLDGTVRLVFIDGLFSPEISDVPALPEGIRAGSLASELKNNPQLVFRYLNRYVKPEENVFTALSAAFILDGTFVSIPENTILEMPLHVLFVSTNRESALSSNPRNIIIIGGGSRVSLIETYCSSAGNGNLTNVVSEIEIGSGAIVDHTKLQTESNSSYHINTTFVHQEERSVYTSNTLVLGGAIVRNSLTAMLDGEGSECTLNGLSLVTGTQLVDNHTVIDHARPHCNSHELYKSILDGQSRGVFNGKIFVRKDAQKTDSKQTNKTLLLSDDATINAKPQLEIFADDVKCTHGATVGQLDEEQVFYLRSRGIDEGRARDILTFAFASDIVDRIKEKSLRSRLERMIRNRLDSERSTD